MIPILYDTTETLFSNNGLGRLRDCISCVVTEERNGVYECDFEYPITGQNYDKILMGRIIAVEHDDSGDVQPFDIVSYTKPIDGVVTFHCQHISYRQSYLTVTSTNINSLSAAFTALRSTSPSNPFSYWTDKTSTGYVGAFDGIPKTVRSVLGGIEGSILDAYGGEYEWDKFDVKLYSERGQYRDFTIRYGVNMLDYSEDYDISGTYSSCIPYWTDGTDKVIGDKQTTTGATITGRGECIPLDVSDRFESKPTKAQVNTMGRSVLNSQNPTLPAQNISVSFVRLQDTGEFSQFSSLLGCRLCDTIKVIFPDFNSSGQFKIVKTEWNVLADRYNSMELGDLSISLSEALGISNSAEKTNDARFSDLYADDFYVDNIHADNPIMVGGYKIITTQTFNADNISVTANGYKEGTISIAKTGYTPIGVLDMYINNASTSGSGSSFVTFYRSYISGTTYYYGIRSVTSSATKVRVYAKILYVATSQGI